MLLQLILFLFRLIACYCGLIFISACVIWSIFSVVLFLTIFFCPVFYFVLGWNLVIFDSSHNHCVLFCCCGCYLVLLGSFVPFMLILVSKLAGLLAIYFFIYLYTYILIQKKSLNVFLPRLSNHHQMKDHLSYQNHHLAFDLVLIQLQIAHYKYQVIHFSLVQTISSFCMN
jgi:hypothetical protein